MSETPPREDAQPAADSPERRRSAGIAAIVVTTFAWAFPPLIIKETAMAPLAFATYRLWMGVLLYAVIFAVTGRRLRWATIKACAPGGLLFALDVGLAFTAFHYTSVADATIIGCLSTVTITIGAARWFGERLQRKDLVFVVASFLGVILVAVGSYGSPSFSLLGDLAAFCSVFSWTAYWLFSKRARANAGALEYMATVMLVAAVVMTVAAPISGASLALPTSSEWIGIFAVALFAGAVGHSLVAWSHDHLEAWLASLILQSQPLVSVTLAWVLLGETIGWVTAAGGAVVLIATAILVVRAGRRIPEEFEDAETTTPST
jgi:drug/metabolite transporter (DMT)-like permease